MKKINHVKLNEKLNNRATESERIGCAVGHFLVDMTLTNLSKHEPNLAHKYPQPPPAKKYIYTDAMLREYCQELTTRYEDFQKFSTDKLYSCFAEIMEGAYGATHVDYVEAKEAFDNTYANIKQELPDFEDYNSFDDLYAEHFSDLALQVKEMKLVQHKYITQEQVNKSHKTAIGKLLAN